MIWNRQVRFHNRTDVHRFHLQKRLPMQSRLSFRRIVDFHPRVVVTSCHIFVLCGTTAIY